MEIKAKAKFIRMSPRKVRLVIDMIRGKQVEEALDILNFSNKWAKRPVIKLLNSAIANATHNFNLQKNNLYIKTIKADGGPMLKRWSPRAFGRAGMIRKRTAHIEIVLDEIKKESKLKEFKKEIKKNKVKEDKAKEVKNQKPKVKNKENKKK